MNKLNRVRTTDAFSGELPAYLSLNRLLNGILSCSYADADAILYKFGPFLRNLTPV